MNDTCQRPDDDLLRFADDGGPAIDDCAVGNTSAFERRARFAGRNAVVLDPSADALHIYRDGGLIARVTWDAIGLPNREAVRHTLENVLQTLDPHARINVL